MDGHKCEEKHLKCRLDDLTNSVIYHWSLKVRVESLLISAFGSLSAAGFSKLFLCWSTMVECLAANAMYRGLVTIQLSRQKMAPRETWSFRNFRLPSFPSVFFPVWSFLLPFFLFSLNWERRLGTSPRGLCTHEALVTKLMRWMFLLAWLIRVH